MEDVAERAGVSRALVSLVVNDLHNPFFAEVIDGIETAAEEQNYRVLVQSSRRNLEREQAAVGGEEPARHTLEPELVVRGTTGPPPRQELR